MKRVLVVEDNADLAYGLRNNLEIEGYKVDVAGDGTRGLALARTAGPDLIILDLMLPGMDGFTVLERLRTADEHLPVLMLTARDTTQDQVRGLENGADDYVVKPFTFTVLAARVKALLRRRESDNPEVLRFDDLSLDTGTRRARRGTRDIDLTSTEYEVLRQFLLHPRRVLPKHLIMDRVWGYDVEGSSNVLEVYVKQLRQKLEADGESRLIYTFRGAGYVLREP